MNLSTEVGQLRCSNLDSIENLNTGEVRKYSKVCRYFRIYNHEVAADLGKGKSPNIELEKIKNSNDQVAAHRLVLAANSPMLGRLLAERGEGEAKLLLPDVPGEEIRQHCRLSICIHID